MRGNRAVSLGSLVRSPAGFQLPERMFNAFRTETYSVDNHCAKDSCGDLFAVLWVLSSAHDGVVAGGEHGAEGAEDYDGEDGDDDAVWCSCQSRVFDSPALVYLPGIPFFRLLATYHVHALKAETTGFMVAGCAALSDVGMGLRGLAWAG